MNTVPYVLPSASGNFLPCLAYTLKEECPFPNDWNNEKNYSDTPGDSGGPTKCGLTQREYDAWEKHHGLPVLSIRNIPQATGEMIFWTDYWMPHCSKLSPGLDLCLFDTNVNEGSHAGVKVLQDALQIEPDGVWGAKTENAIRLCDAKLVIPRFTICRIAAYKRVIAEHPSDSKFWKDWDERAERIGAAALVMAQKGARIGTTLVQADVVQKQIDQPEMQPEMPPATKPIAEETPIQKVLDLLRGVLKQ